MVDKIIKIVIDELLLIKIISRKQSWKHNTV